uniref:Putative glycosyltransferase n=1 Tax=viral metagenome TaxID=1070528 RepID=A0A6H1ZAS3_9ZZZZ
MRLDTLINDGSPRQVHCDDIGGNDKRVGVGGAELALLTLLEGWHNQGHEVVLYNDPLRQGSPFEQRPIDAFDKNAERDILIVFRSPNHRAFGARGLRVWWSTDQYTQGSFAEFAPAVNKIVTISPFHSRYFFETYGIRDTVSIDLPVRTWEYKQSIEKVRNRCLFASIPDRGLHELALCWPQIVKEVPDASLAITSDYRLWGCAAPLNEQYIGELFRLPNVRFLGAVRRSELIVEQMQADVLAYPCQYAELFCITCAEAQVAGVYPVTSNMGALPITNMGIVIPGDPKNPLWRTMFIDKVVETLKDPGLRKKQEALKARAIKRFNLERILREWDKKVFS